MKVPGGTPKYGAGVWMINDGQPTIDGTWEIRFVGRRLKGNWNLTRID